MSKNEKLCRYCRREIDKKASHCPFCGKRQPGSRVLIIIITIIFVLVLMGILSSSDSDNTSSTEDIIEEATGTAIITIEEYNQIKDGMSVDEVVEIVGGDGTIQSSSEMVGIKTEIYIWYGDKPGSDALITFSDGKVFSKAQVNLE